MSRRFARITLIAALAPLALGLASCKKEEPAAGDATASAKAFDKVPAPAGKTWADVVSVTPEGGYVMGNPEAPIKVMEFGALSCSHCAEFAEKGFAKLRDEYVNSGRVSVEMRLFMLNALDVPAALLATCGSPETVIPLSEQFWAWQPEMFTNLQKVGQPQLDAASSLPANQRYGAIAKLAGMSDFFAARGLSLDQGAACLADATKAEALAKQTQVAGEKYNVQGTPTFLINGSNVGSMSWEAFEPMLQRAGAR